MSKNYFKKAFVVFMNLVILMTVLPNISIKVNAAYDNTHINTGNQREDIVKVAETQIGYHEGENNDTKYNRWNGKISGYPVSGYGYPWCHCFVSWCANQANISTNIIPRTAGTSTGKSFFVKQGTYKQSAANGGNYIPQRGDIIYYGSGSSPSHVGIVSSCNGSTVYTIEGNYSDKVGTRAISLSNSYIIGYGVPNYNLGSNPNPPTPNNDDELGIPYPRPQVSSTVWLGKNGITSGNYVRWLQTALNKADNAGLAVDGQFGSGTTAAVKNFQKKYGLTQDGQAGTATINKLVELLKSSTVPKGNEMSKGAGQTIADGDYWIESALSKRYLVDINGDNYDTINGTNLKMHIWNSDTFGKYDVFTFKYLNNGFYQITQRTTNMSIDVNEASEERGANVQMWTSSNSTAQQWSITKTSDGYKLQAKCSGFCLDVYGGNVENNSNLNVWEDNGTKAQRFNFIPYKCTHSFSSWTISQNSTCTSDGKQVRKCSECGYSEEKIIAKTGHKYTDSIVAPTCTEKGYTNHICSVCKDSYTDKETNQKGHTFTSKIISGYMTCVCPECGYMYTAPFEGEGTAESPFIISNADELRAVSETVNNTEINSVFGHAYYKQTADIDLENISWTPIGLGHNGEDGRGKYNYQTRMFHGVYDGNQHTIYNLNIDKNWKYSGLFGAVRNSGAKVCNLVVYGNISAGENSGGITAETHYYSAIENCAFIGNVKGIANVGGIVGLVYDSGTIRNCYHNGIVTGEEDVGGIAGAVSFNEYNNDEDSTLIENCYHVNGEISGETCGAIVGDCVYFNGKNNTITLKNCYASKSNAYFDRNGEATYDDTMVLPDSFLKEIAEDLGEAYIDNTNPELNNGFPVFSWQLDIILEGDADNNGVVDVNDAIMLRNWLHGSGELTNWENVDLCKDGVINIFDLCLLRKILAEELQ
ncbi:MAG: RICIN domain-containing protein [Oscillospiraceae bacterium]|nr:RICIN domain-containing protein [Oscillospiraceae bacterium]